MTTAVRRRDRYKVTWSPFARSYKILDHQMQAYCALPHPKTGEVIQLGWKQREAAEAFLQRCYLVWRQKPAVGQPHPQPFPMGKGPR